MQLIQYATSFMAISQLLFMGLFYLAYYRRQLLGKLMAFYALCLIGYILATLPEVDNGPWLLDLGLGLLAIAAPAVLWVITRYLFEDNPRVDPLIWATMALYIGLRVVGILIGAQDGLGFWLHSVVPQVVMLGFAVHVVYTAVTGLGTDLVEPRRELRVPFAITMGSIVAMIVGSYFLNITDRWIFNVYIGAIFLFILFFNLASFRLHRDAPQLIDPVAPAASTIAPHTGRVSDKDKDKPLIDRIHAVMENDRLYAQPGLTIGQLAASVSLQEYRLRRLINQKLHYRNFNQYLNQYRIAEAARRLQDPEESHLPISTIALDVGYASLSSFNKAFKEAHGVTPSIFRGRATQ